MSVYIFMHDLMAEKNKMFSRASHVLSILNYLFKI